MISSWIGVGTSEKKYDLTNISLIYSPKMFFLNIRLVRISPANESSHLYVLMSNPNRRIKKMMQNKTQMSSFKSQSNKRTLITENDHLIEFQLIEIVFYHLIEIMLITWSNFTWPNQLIEILIMSFWVILNFRSTAKIHQFFFGNWSKVLIMVF